MVLAFIGGFSIMSIELLAGRMLAPFFGSSIYVWGSIITVFMLSLSLGYLLGGRLSVRAPSLRKFGYIFLAAGATITPLLLAGNVIMEAVFAAVEDPRYGSLLASVALFFIPTVAMGTISPYAVRLLVDTVGHSGQVAGFLYFVSTLGSALGTLLTSFYFVLWFEVTQILISLGLALIACGLAAIVFGRGTTESA
ncbi:MAG: fused MFS/spermidine synthase [Gammaproteobacteria bacterium]|nr:fused MFS/spermidine synthase [Gammaproteobacteria bacterium]